MLSKVLITGFTILTAIPVFANTTKFDAGQVAAAPPKPVALRLMSDTQFTTFLGRLDSELLRSELQLKKMDVKSVSLDLQEKQELGRSYARCLQSLEDTREEIRKLLQKQTLKLDLFLLIDLNQLARDLDSLDEGLMSPAAVSGTSGAQKSMGYARQVLGIDGELSAEISTFQHHFIAFTGIVDATLDQPEQDPSQPPTQK